MQHVTKRVTIVSDNTAIMVFCIETLNKGAERQVYCIHLAALQDYTTHQSCHETHDHLQVTVEAEFRFQKKKVVPGKFGKKMYQTIISALLGLDLLPLQKILNLPNYILKQFQALQSLEKTKQRERTETLFTDGQLMWTGEL